MRKLQPQELVNPNLIPMIDIMFLLLLFFMLGADMGQRELEEVRLPKAAEVKIDKPEEKDGRLTINAHQVLDLQSTAWSLADDPPLSRHGLASAVVGGRWFVFNGGETAGLSTSDLVDIFTP